MSLIGRDAILAAEDLPYEEIEVPEWGGTVRIKTMTGAERDDFEASCIQGRGKNRQFNHRNVRARLLVRCLVDEQGQRLFGDGDAAALGRKSARALDRLFDAAQRLNKISDEDVDELAGESETGQNDSSS